MNKNDIDIELQELTEAIGELLAFHNLQPSRPIEHNAGSVWFRDFETGKTHCVKHFDSWTAEERRLILLEWLLATAEHLGIVDELEDYYYQLFIDNDKVRPIP